MNRPKVFVTRPGIPQEGIDMLKERCEVEIYDEDKPIDRDALLEGVKGKDALLCLLTDIIDKEVVETAGPQLKVIATMSVAFDHVNFKVRKENGEWMDLCSPIKLSNFPNATFGIVSMGGMGQGVLERMLPFGPFGGVDKILYFDVFHPIKPAEEMGAQYSYVEFEELLTQSDIIVAMCFLSEQTRNLFNKKAFDLMKPTAVFVNTSREGVVNQDDLYDALKNKKIRAAALEAILPEFLSKEHPLTTLDNIVLTPDVGSAEVSVRVKMATLAAETILAVLDGKRIVPPVHFL